MLLDGSYPCPVLAIENLEKLQAGFLLDRLLPDYGRNLRRMRGIAFDWGRYDPTQSHVTRIGHSRAHSTT